MTKHRPTFVAVLLALLFIAWPALPARAEARVDELQVDAQLDRTGVLTVQSTFTGADLGSSLQLRLPGRTPLGDLRHFVHRIGDVAVTAQDRELPHAVDKDGADTVITFDPGKAGGEPITLRYTVRGTTSTPAGQDATRTFAWALVQGLNVDVDRVRGSLTLPAVPVDFTCRAGDRATLRHCAMWSVDRHTSDRATFEDGPLPAGQVIDVTAGQPAAQVASTAQVETRWTLDRAFALTVPTAVGSIAVLLLGAIALWVWHRRVGRDELAQRAPTVIGEFHPVAEGVSEFRLVEDVRPGQVGTVADESVDPIDVTATIIDLAVRGHLRIDQLDVPGGIDWTFTRRDASEAALRPYERMLLDLVAPADGEPALVSGIRTTVGPHVRELREALYQDVVEEGWFSRRPDAARTDSRTIGAGLLVVGLVATALLAWLTSWGLVGVAIIAVGVASLFVAGEMPRRSAKGAALLAGLHGFSAILAQQRTDVLPEGRELREISRILPYAIVLGGKDRWIDAMVAADLDESPDPDAIDWYHAPGDWHLQQLPQSLDALIASIQGHLFGR
ncbi:DUF2207 domain-containing protein [uncultured Tessaracoccus sp.]|uniref:DUF2207 domain-containing protein n=1 Tax=uncultured Tessaracoccus sp. TaxID=905023 RepID=UPI0025F3DFD3|nr:DUF2207 domain-containing protein [uncultured Tessaracoccus sp.]